jgi:hypothetical protein
MANRQTPRKLPKRVSYTEHQNFLYNRALHGLSIYTPEEVVIMTPEKRKKIIQIHKKTQKILNLWKQEIVNTLANKLFTDIFPDMEITECLVKFGVEGDPEYINNMSFKLLKISKQDIIAYLIDKKILPKNFNELNKTQDASRISSKRGSDISSDSRKLTGGRALESANQAG